MDYQASSNKSDREVPSRVQFKGNQSCFRVHQTSGCRCLIHFPLPCSCASSESDKEAGNLGSRCDFLETGDRYLFIDRLTACLWLSLVLLSHDGVILDGR